MTLTLALVNDTPRQGSAMSREYARLTVEACAAHAGVGVDIVELAAIDHDYPGGKVPPIADLRAARADVLNRVDLSGADAVVSLGTGPLNALSPLPRATTMKAEHGRMRWLDLPPGSTRERVPWVPAIAPFQAVRNSDLHRDFANVVYKAVTQRAPLPPTDIETHVADDARDLSALLGLLEGATVVGVDVETTGLSPWRDRLLAVGVGAVSETVDGASFGVAVVVPRHLLDDDETMYVLWDGVWRKSRRSVGHNFKFDMQFLQAALEWPPHGALVGDTLLLAHLNDERPSRPDSRARGSGLKDLVAQRYDHQYGFDFASFYEQPEDKRDWDAMHSYLGEDVVYTARLWHDLERDAAEEGSRVLWTHDSLLAPASVAVARAEFAGAPIDVPWVQETIGLIDRRITRRRAALERALPALAKTVAVTNVLAPAQVADVMYDDWGMTPDVRKHGRAVTGDRSTDADHVDAAVAKYIDGRDPLMARRAVWLRSLVRLRKDVRLESTYRKSILERVDSDGRLRASFLLHGASTGRLSSREPNLQNVPAVDDREEGPGGTRYKLRDGQWAARPMRRAFAPPAGRVWVEADYSQLELRVAAGLSGDPDFIEVFRGGRDVHREVSSAIFSKDPGAITKPERYLAKAVAFGILYGRTAEALAGGAEMDYAVRELGMARWTTEVAQAFINKFLRSYPVLQRWISDTHVSTLRDLYVESPYGRRRRFPLSPRSRSERNSIMRQAVNTPIQSAASDICLEAMTEVTRRLVEDYDISAQVLFPVHDSICIEAADGEVDILEAMCRDVMEKDWHGVPLTVDFEYGPSWADVAKH